MMEIEIGAHYGEPATVQLSEECAVHTHHEWEPTNIHHVWPKGMGGPDTKANKVVVCMNGHGAIHAYIQLLIKYDGKIPNDTRMHFGLKVRNLARSGWEQAGMPTTGGGGE